MGLNFGQIALAAVGGAAEKFNIDRETLRKEYSRKKERQQQWADGPGRTVLARLEQDSNAALDAGETLLNYGMNETELKYLVKTHKPRSLITLAAELNKLDATELTALKNSGKLNEVIKVADDFEPSEEAWAKTVVKNFRGPDLTPRQKDAGSKSFLAGLFQQGSEKYYRDELDEFEDDEFIVGSDGESYSIRELKAAASYVPERGTVAPFDLSAIGGRGTDREWINLKKLILDKASMDIKENGTSEDLSAFNENTAADGMEGANANERLQNLRGDKLKKYLEKATRDLYANEDFKNAFTNIYALQFYGGQPALDAILNPEPAKTEEQLLDELNIDLEEQKLTGDKRPEEIDSDEKLKAYFQNNNVDYVISEGVLRKRKADSPYDPDTAEPPTDTSAFNESTFILNEQPTKAVVDARPVIESGALGGIRPRDRSKLTTWDNEFKGKYNNDGTYKIVSPKPSLPSNMDDLSAPEKNEASLVVSRWERLYGETHNPVTGYPKIQGLDLSLIPNAEVPE